MTNALLIHPQDDVAVVTQAIAVGDKVIFGDGQEVIATQAIPVYHKIALRNVKKGDVVHKYNNIIGEASEDILVGHHVHTHNVSSTAKKEDA